ncbi:MAG: type III pantothenate kinase [Gemmataceae bacterium]|nr:type III pantothenate kinase [Gemmataceae bacterium]
MKPAVVVDVGNTRIKWGRCGADRIEEIAPLPADDPVSWQRQCEAWRLPADACWVLSGVHPSHRDRLRQWLLERGSCVGEINSYRQVPIEVAVDFPEKVGIDRLLNAAAAQSRRPAGKVAFLVDAGSAVTVDVLDEAGRFRGGAIMPGLRLMADTLHRMTAMLPLVGVTERFDPPGRSTIPAMQAGIFHAVLGGIESLLRSTRTLFGDEGILLFGGGDAAILAPHLSSPTVIWPEMTLEGIRRTALAMAEPMA